ncbi:gamma-aminobutyric acid receptor subunit beta-like [Pollicipes pollicipes]|uniref:gamma-aminobutyric acid receptor subunit beta-like n=1 Tax=Pollicipes pollicipes TaxID=41117 RepID=UPI0018853FC1|nr:gamma-aminobutyric acid receptor subunit beta-like [Pollicipes pollicipes]
MSTPRPSKGDTNISAILDMWQQGYDKRLRPDYGGEPVTIGITLHVTSIGSVSEVNMDFTIDFFFRQFWRDSRMAFVGDGIDALTIGSDFIKNIWVPDTYFPNEKTSYYHQATASNEFLRVQPTGDVLRSIRPFGNPSSGCSRGLELDMASGKEGKGVSRWARLRRAAGASL